MSSSPGISSSTKVNDVLSTLLRPNCACVCRALPPWNLSSCGASWVDIDKHFWWQQQLSFFQFIGAQNRFCWKPKHHPQTKNTSVALGVKKETLTQELGSYLVCRGPAPCCCFSWEQGCLPLQLGGLWQPLSAGEDALAETPAPDCLPQPWTAQGSFSSLLLVARASCSKPKEQQK